MCNSPRLNQGSGTNINIFYSHFLYSKCVCVFTINITARIPEDCLHVHERKHMLMTSVLSVVISVMNVYA